MGVATIIKFLLLTLASCSNGQNLHCIPLRDCPSLMLLLQNRDEVPNMTRVQVYEYLSSKTCGFEEGINPKVECPVGKFVFIFYFLFSQYRTVNKNDLNFLVEEDADHVDEEFQLARSGVIDVQNNRYTCQGSLTIFHADANGGQGINFLDDFKVSRLRRQRYRDVRRNIFKDRRIIKVQSNGNCCWKFYEKSFFRGASGHIDVGFSGLSMEPGSIKRIECDF